MAWLKLAHTALRLHRVRWTSMADRLIGLWLIGCVRCICIQAHVSRPMAWLIETTKKEGNNDREINHERSKDIYKARTKHTKE